MSDVRESYYKYAEEYPDGKRFLPLDVLKEMFNAVYPNGMIDDYPVPAARNVNADGVVCEAIVYTDVTKGTNAKWAHAAADRVTALPDDIEENNCVTPQAAAQAAAVRKALACVGIALPASEVYKNYRSHENAAPKGNTYNPPEKPKENAAQESSHKFPTVEKKDAGVTAPVAKNTEEEPKQEIVSDTGRAEETIKAQESTATIEANAEPAVLSDSAETLAEDIPDEVPIVPENDGHKSEDTCTEEKNKEDTPKPARKRGRPRKTPQEAPSEENTEDVVAEAKIEGQSPEDVTVEEAEDCSKTAKKRGRPRKAEQEESKETAPAEEATDSASGEGNPGDIYSEKPISVEDTLDKGNEITDEYEKELLAKAGAKSYDEILKAEVRIDRMGIKSATMAELPKSERGRTMLMFLARKNTRISQMYPSIEYAAKLIALHEGVLTREQLDDLN